MAKFKIQGGALLNGSVEVSGAKNAALKIIPASILSSEEITITNLPDIEDVKTSLSLLTGLGARINKINNGFKIETDNIRKVSLDPDLSCKFRASIIFVGPLLARFGEVKFSHPGGCVIGAGGRPIDLFLEGFASLGAEVSVNEGKYLLRAKKLKGDNYFFPVVSVTATESLMITAVLAEGTTILSNCAMEPEIVSLAEYFNQQGAKISGAGTPKIIIEGVKKVRGGHFEVIPDRIETGSFGIMAAATKSDITITKCNPRHIEILLNIFKKIGVPYETGKNWLKIKPAKKIKSYNVKTHEYPGFPTDLQAPYTVLMTQAEGSSLIHETIYDRRLLYVDMLSQMGADITVCDPHRVLVKGPTKLYGRRLISPDLRAGIALVIAALVAQGESVIDKIELIDRGYERIEERLNLLGVKIERNK